MDCAFFNVVLERILEAWFVMRWHRVVLLRRILLDVEGLVGQKFLIVCLNG
jgi:hypothetical protein